MDGVLVTRPSNMFLITVSDVRSLCMAGSRVKTDWAKPTMRVFASSSSTPSAGPQPPKTPPKRAVINTKATASCHFLSTYIPPFQTE